MASQKLVNSPEARPLINALDYAQRTNTIGSLTADDVSQTITAPVVMAGQTNEISRHTLNALSVQKHSLTPNPSPIERGTDKVLPIGEDLGEALRALNRRLTEPFVTVNTVTGDSGIKKAQDDYEKYIKNKTPKSRR